MERYGKAGTGTRHLTEYMLELAKAYNREVDRPVWLQEFGVSTEWMGAADRDDYLVAATEISASVDGLWGITWWCSHDVERSLTGFVELEYDLGLLTVDNEIKSLGHRFREVVTALRNASASPVVSRTTAVVLPDELTPDLEFADTFFTLIDRGVRPAIVLASASRDAGYLRARGIEELVTV
ncbi:hypothetical protein B7R22_17555 [Subtercola boreus]|uniref:Glycoside hydrolase family 5 domain-containing protein n=1 Tax=Subtercola boreus TaxID=120213 RepID=A0A3E0VQ35_9MICO|nr:hypothetical protein [Subtercola boreus]RFA11821.1 hypothetical protein B7R22_17555 [Subtercola boreus]